MTEVPIFSDSGEPTIPPPLFVPTKAWVPAFDVKFHICILAKYGYFEWQLPFHSLPVIYR